MSYDQVVGASGGDDASSSVAVIVEGSSLGGGIQTFAGVVSSTGATGSDDVGRSG